MLQPTRTKFRKAFKGRIHGKASRAVTLNYGQFGLKAFLNLVLVGCNIFHPFFFFFFDVFFK